MSVQLTNWLGRALVPIAVLVVFALARRFLLVTPEPPLSGAHRMICRSFQNYAMDIRDQHGGGWPCVRMVNPRTPSLAEPLYSMSQSGSEPRLLPQTAIWWFFPGFGAVALGYELTLQLGQPLVTDRRQLFTISGTATRRVLPAGNCSAG